MPCLNKINHTIQYGDSLYKISKMYNVTIQDILNQNQYLNPYNLQVGNTITICANAADTYDNSIYSDNQLSSDIDETFDNQKPQDTTNIDSNTQQNFSQDNNVDFDLYDNNIVAQLNTSQDDNINMSQYNDVVINAQQDTQQFQQVETENKISNIGFDLFTKMHFLWQQHVHWTRMFLISVAEDLPDLSASNKRLLQNPDDIAKLYEQYYGDEIASKINNLLTEHLEIGREIISAFNRGINLDESEMVHLQDQWRQNANNLTEYLSSINPHYSKINLQDMLYSHLDLLSKGFIARIRNEYDQEVLIYDVIMEEIIKIAGYLANGIIMQFPDKF